MTAPIRFRHLPTEVEAMHFTEGNQAAVDHWLATELGREHYSMTGSHLMIETAQGDTDVVLGSWVIKAEIPGGFEFYGVAPHVIAKRYEPVPS